MRVKTVLVLSVVVTVLLLAAVTYAFPAIDDLFIENPFWNGLSELYERTNPVRLDSLDVLDRVVQDPRRSTLLLIGPSREFSDDDVDNIRLFIYAGGTVVLADDFGTGNDLLQGLNIPIRFHSLLLQDRLFNAKNGLMPKILDEGSALFDGVEHLVFNYPSTLAATRPSKILAWSSVFSYVAREPVAPTQAVKAGPFPVVAEVELGEGRLIAVSDSSLFINSMVDRGGNSEFLENLVGGVVYIDEGHSMPSRLTAVKNYGLSLYSFFGNAEIRYGFSLLVVVFIFKVNWTNIDDPAVDEVEEVLRRHPEYDRDMVMRLERERRRARGTK